MMPNLMRVPKPILHFDARYRGRYCILMVGVCRRVQSLKVRVFSSLGVVFAPYPLTTTISYTAPYSYPPLTTLLYLSPCLHSSRLRPVKPNARPIHSASAGGGGRFEGAGEAREGGGRKVGKGGGGS